MGLNSQGSGFFLRADASSREVTFAELGFCDLLFCFLGQKVDSGRVGVILIGQGLCVENFWLLVSICWICAKKSQQYFDWAKCRTSVACHQPNTTDIVSVGKRTSVPIQSPS